MEDVMQPANAPHDRQTSTGPHGALVPWVHDAGSQVNLAIQPYEGPAPASAGLSPAVLLKAFKARWPLALLAGFLLALPVAGLVWFLVPPKYQTSALVRVLGSEPKVLANERYVEADRNSYIKGQLALVGSPHVLRNALRNEKVRNLEPIRVQADPAAWLASQIRVGIVEDSDLLRISMAGNDANEVEVLVNGVLDSYLEMSEKVEKTDQMLKLDELRKIYDSSNKLLREEKDLLQGLIKTLKTADPATLSLRQKNAYTEYTVYRAQAAVVRRQLQQAVLQGQLAKIQMEYENKKEMPDAIIDEAVENNKRVAKLIDDVAGLKRHLDYFKKVAQPGTPSLLKVQDTYRKAEKDLKDLKAEVRKKIVARLNRKADDNLKLFMKRNEKEVSELTNQVAAMKKDEDELRHKAEELGVISSELEVKRAEVDQAELLVRSLRQEKMKLEVEIQSAKKRIIVMHRGDKPESKVATAQIQWTSVAGVLAFLCGILGVSYREYRHRRIQTAEDFTNGLPLRVVGSLPMVPRRSISGSSRAVTSDRRWERAMAESVSYVRTVLLTPLPDGRMNKVMLIASAEPREGKTMLAAQLAVSLAGMGRRVLLIDGDMRRPTLNGMFNVARGPGLCEILRGETDAAAAILPTGVEELSILPAGDFTLDVPRRLVQPELGVVMQGLREQFDFIIVDSSPLLPISDALFLARQADGVVLCVRPTVSRFPAVQSATERLRGLHIPLLGVVVNGVRHEYRSDAYQHLYATAGSN
jgi:capsular exopolysaccharide synthesis family protein